MDSGDGNSARKIAGGVVTISFPSDSDSNCPADLGSGGWEEVDNWRYSGGRKHRTVC